jgi:hypothetical protein
VGALQAFVSREGHSCVTQSYTTEHAGKVFKLGSWVRERRKDRSKNRLTHKRIAALDSLGFDWNPYETNFQQGLKALRLYILREGDARVSLRHREEIDGHPFNLGTWASARRAERIKGRLSDERIADLDALVFDWNPHETDYQDGLKALRQYKERKGHARVPARHKERVDNQLFNLGGWVSHRRRDKRKEKFSDDRVAELNALGFDWDPNESDYQIRDSSTKSVH